MTARLPVRARGAVGAVPEADPPPPARTPPHPSPHGRLMAWDGRQGEAFAVGRNLNAAMESERIPAADAALTKTKMF